MPNPVSTPPGPESCYRVTTPTTKVHGWSRSSGLGLDRNPRRWGRLDVFTREELSRRAIRTENGVVFCSAALVQLLQAKGVAG